MLAVINARIETVTNGIIENGTILAQDGKIVAIGAQVDVPETAKIINAAGRAVTPGIIEAHSHLGINEQGIGWAGSDGNEATAPITPWCCARDGINMRDIAMEEFREAGITTAGILPGSANLIGGTAVTIKLKRTNIVDEAIIKNPMGMKAALGENPKNVYGGRKKSPGTRMGSAAVFREALLKAKQYLNKVEAATCEKEMPKYDKQCDALLPVMRREIPLLIHSHRADDIATAVRLCDQFNVRYTIEHATDGYLLVDFFKAHDIECSVGPTMKYGSKVENKDRDFRTPVLFAKAGVNFCFTTDHPVIAGRHLRTTAGIAVGWGMERADALKAITYNSARHMGLEDRVGSLEVGKDADFVVWSGDPLAFTTFADISVIDGEIVYKREVQ